jgi:hypothetical protein
VAAVLERAGLQRQGDGSGDQQHRQEQVGGDDRPAQVGRDGEEPDRRLGQRSQEDREGETDGVSREPRRATGGQPSDQRQRDRDPADEAVPELDERVRVLRRQRMAGLAPGPVAAAQAGIGEPDGRAGGDDQPERGELDEHESEERRRRELERAQPRDRRRVGVHADESSPGMSPTRPRAHPHTPHPPKRGKIPGYGSGLAGSTVKLCRKRDDSFTRLP